MVKFMIILKLKNPQLTGEIINGALKGIQVYNYLFTKVGEDEYISIPSLLNSNEKYRIISKNKVVLGSYNEEDYYAIIKTLSNRIIFKHRILERKNYGEIIKVVKTGNCATDFIQFFNLYHLTTDNKILEQYYPDTWKKYIKVTKLFNPHKHIINNCQILDNNHNIIATL